MRLTHLSLEQFRSYAASNLEFSSSGAHVLLGPNAAGKTNILEAIALLSLGKSCRKAEEGDLMQWKTEHYRVRAQLATDAGEERNVEIVSQSAPRQRKACFVNDVSVNIGAFVGALPTVLFLPEDLDLFTGSPQRRRQFLDQLLCQVSPEYLRDLAQYQKVLKQRNGLLRQIAEKRTGEEALPIWEEQLAACGARVSIARLELIEILQCTLAEELLALGEQWSDARLTYERKSSACSEPDLRTELSELLATYRRRDIALQSTTVGPHREDWQLLVEGRELPRFASRGQQRTAVLALLFLQVSYLELKRGEKPIILLDDVFSELDDAHQSALLAALEEHQVFITATHMPENLRGARVWKVGSGEVAENVASASINP